MSRVSSLRILAVCAAWFLCAPSALAADDDESKRKGQLLTPQEALDLAFPKAKVTRETLVLDEDARMRATKLAGVTCDKGIAHPYVARDKDGKLLGTAWFDTHKVRTQRETLMVVVDTDDKVARIEVLAFAEPKRYLPRAKWYAQYTGKRLDAKLDLKQDIRGISGATLSARATNDAVRRVLALHAVNAEIAREKAAAAARKKREREDAARKAAEKDARKKGDR